VDSLNQESPWLQPGECQSHDSPQTPEPNSYRIDFANKKILEFNYEVIQLNQLQWQAFVNQRNPLASALMPKMQMDITERSTVKLVVCVINSDGL
jgi:hypothetical protein